MNKKVYILTILVFVMATNAVFSQTTTKKLSYQAVVRNAANELVVNQNLSVEITILNANNVPQYKETHATVPTNQNGLLWLWVGDGTPTLGTMDNVVWKDATIKSVFTLPDGSTVEQNTPVTAMPYAYFADEVDTIFLQDYLTTHNYGNDDYVTHQELNDTLNHYYTNEQVDAALIPYATNAHLNDTLSHYLMKEVQVLSISHDTIFLTGGSFVVLPKGFSGSYHDLVDTPTNVSAFTNDAGYLTEHQSLEGYVTQDALNDTLSYYTTTGNIDTLLGAYFDSTKVKTAIHDTASALRALMGDAANDGLLMIVAAGDTTRFTANQATNDTVRLNQFATKDTLANFATTEDLANYEPREELCGDVKNCIKDTLDKYTTTNQLDSVIRKYGYVTTAHLNDTLNEVYTTIRTDSSALHKAIKDTAAAIRGDICDSATACITKALADANSDINHAIDTIARYNIHDTASALRAAIHDSLSGYKIKDCADVTTCVDNALKEPNSTTNHAIDSIASNVIHDSIKTNIQTNINKTIHDSIVNKISKQIHDSIGNGQITIQKNGTTITDGSFNLNQKTNQTINITVPTQTSELTNNSNLAYTTGNTFSGAHDFTTSGTTITVPSNTDAIKRPVPTTSPATECTNMNAVNVCDLLAVFDSLSRRIDTLQKQLNELKSATPPSVSVNLSEVQYTSMKATATASGNGADITSYQFCISTNSNMSDATCFTSPSNEYTFTGLEPYTTYYVTADATNMVGTTTSAVVTKQTAVHAPTGTFSLGSIAPTGFKVTVSSLDFKEPGAGTVQICYKKKEGNCSSNFADYTTCDVTLNLTSSTTDTTRKFIELDDPDVEYCVIVKLNNGDSTTILEPMTITTGAAISLDITHTPTTLNLCGGSLEVTYTATTNPSTVDLNDFENFIWSEGTSVNNTTTVTYTSAGNKTITCTATHKNEGYTITGSSSINVVNTGSGPAFAFCNDDLSLNIITITSSATTLNWGDGSSEESNPSTSSTHDYSTDGIYSLVATNSEGCSTTKQAAVGIATLHPCTVTSINANEQGSGTTIEKLQDVDDNLYAVVQIGKQCWMKSNLRTTHYSDGTAIANGTGNSANNTTSHTTAYYYQPTASSNFGADFDFSHYNLKTDGLFYNWKAVMQGAAGSTTVPSRVQGVCPDGWHVPSVREWDTLFAFVQTLPNATYWDYHSIGYAHTLAGSCEWTPGTNNGCMGNYQAPAWSSSELSIVPAGEASVSFRYNTYVGPTSTQEAIFWTTNAAEPFASSPQAWACEFYDGTIARQIEDTYTSFGHSVRCVRDYGEGSPISDPSATSENVTDIDRTTATLNGTVINPDNANITSKGFEWKLSSATNFTTVTVTGDEFTYTLTGLTPGTSYTYRAFVEYAGGTVYGDNISFTTIILPTVATNEATSIGETTATLNGTLTNPDNLTVTSKGFEWKQSSAADYTQALVAGDDFILNLTGLTNGTEYSFRVFMIFENNTEYGVEKTFTTITPPTVATDAAADVEVNTATLKGSIVNPDNVILTSKGFEWKLSTATDYTTVTVTGDGLTYELTGLSENTSYTYRAFIIYAGGIVYGDEASFTTDVPTPKLTITPDPANGATVCSGGSTTVTYMAKVEEGTNDISDNYSYTWSIPNNLQYINHGKTCTVIYTTSGTHTVTCKASHVPGDTLTKTEETTVSSVSGTVTVPTFSICDHCGDSLTVTVKSVTSGSTIQWLTGTTYESVSAGSWHNYTQQGSGIYIITVTKGNCSSTKRVALGNATLKPCLVNYINPNERGTGSTIDSLQDIDGNWYGVVQIGSQCWMKSNLRTTHYADGNVEIGNGNGAPGSKNKKSDEIAYYYYPTSSSLFYSDYDFSKYNIKTYGFYYNWTAAMNGASSSTSVPSGVQGVCPDGWHLPSKGEVDTLIKYAQSMPGATSTKYAHVLAGDCDWYVVTSNGYPGYYTQTGWGCIGFSAIPVGWATDKFYHNKRINNQTWQQSYCWTSTEGSSFSGSRRAYDFGISTSYNKMYCDNDYIDKGLPVRCVRN